MRSVWHRLVFRSLRSFRSRPPSHLAQDDGRYSILRERVIGIAIEPALAGFRGGDDRVSAGAGVFGGVAVGGVVAAKGDAAFLAGAQVDPSRADLDAFLALMAFC